MPKPTTTTEGRDYGKRLYVSRQSYQKQMRRLTDAHRDRGARVPHSESKKPYLPDQGYQEMEYFDTPWDGPNFPGYPGYPDDPGINDDPEVDGFHGGGNPPKDPHSNFLGCEFYTPFQPPVVSAGDIAVAKLERRDDPIIGFTVHGPGSVATGGNAANCTASYQRSRSRGGSPPQPGSPECTAVLKVDSDIDFDKWGTQGNMLEIAVVAHTLSGSSCSSSVWVLKCENVDPMSWDTDLSGTTITRNGSCVVAILGGFGPYKWTVSGTDFSMQTESTPIDGRTNLLLAGSDACGVATITIKDNCENTVTGSVRCTTGSWHLLDTSSGCVAGGAATSYDCPGGIGHLIREDIAYKCDSFIYYASGAFYNPTYGCTDCAGFCDCETPNGFCEYCTSCSPCVTGSLENCAISNYEGFVPCAHATFVDAYRCLCEWGYDCWEWRC